MCMDHKMMCKCGSSTASFNFRDEVMPVEVINKLYCPRCSGDISYDAGSMVADNGWLIDYDMDIAKFAASKLTVKSLTPEFIFDEGYCTWRGMYPTDYVDSVREREELISLSKINRQKYLDEFKKWGINRMERLANEGWRKAHVGQ